MLSQNSSLTHNFRINEMTVANERLKIQVAEKDKSLSALQRTVSALEQQVAADQTESENAKTLKEETENLHAALRLVWEVMRGIISYSTTQEVPIKKNQHQKPGSDEATTTKLQCLVEKPNGFVTAVAK